METYLITFTKKIPVARREVGRAHTVKTEPWQTTINADSDEEAEDIARTLGSHIRQRLGKGYDIVLDSVEYIY